MCLICRGILRTHCPSFVALRGFADKRSDRRSRSPRFVGRQGTSGARLRNILLRVPHSFLNGWALEFHATPFSFPPLHSGGMYFSSSFGFAAPPPFPDPSDARGKRSPQGLRQKPRKPSETTRNRTGSVWLQVSEMILGGLEPSL